MKKALVKSIILVLTVCLGIGYAASFCVTANAKTKKAAKVQTAEEQQLEQLKAYRSSLVKAGADAATVALTDQSIATLESVIAYNKAQEQILAQQAAAEAAYQASMANIEATLQKGFKRPANDVVFVGDSRFVQMRTALCGYGANIIAQGWMGYDWMVDTAIPTIDPCLGKGHKVVINLGVNDLENIDKYITTINAQAAAWAARGVKVYYATVNPVSGNNYAVDEFNRKLVNKLVGVNIIDTNRFLKTYGYHLVDDVHYDGPTNINIYSYIMSQL